MKVEDFDLSWLADLSKPDKNTSKFGNGQVTIVGGSSLFHGAPILALKVASRVAGMVYFASYFEDREVANLLKKDLQSFIWIPRDEVGDYIRKSQAVLIGPGMMRSHARVHNPDVVDEIGHETKELTLRLFEGFADKQFVVDGGSLQVVRPEELPKGSVITPNAKEFMILFGEEPSDDKDELIEQVRRKAEAFNLVIVHKGRIPLVTDGRRVIVLPEIGVNLAKGAVGDVLAGLIVGLIAKNEPILAAASAAFLVDGAARKLYKERADMFNGDDLAEAVAKYYGELLNN